MNLSISPKLQESIEDDNLVVFVGAGVSMPPPSNLPSFKKLAEEICKSEVKPEFEDRELGEKCRSGFNVHARCQKIINNPESKHTELHENILKIFKTGNKVRVVTTNFDNHFFTAFKSVFKDEKPKEYHAPALPIGDRFKGIVHLHGSVVQNCKELVLTDKDFGEAYLAKGWATKFLIDLFSEYNVLFVGFSHKDATFTYLSRGLNPLKTKKRWVFRPDDEKLDYWKHLDIEVITYPKDPSNSNNPHCKLSVYFSEWAEYQSFSLKSKIKGVKKIGSELPPESELGKGPIEIYLRDNSLLRALVGAIKDPAWLSWFEKNNHFNNFFDDSVKPLNENQRILGNWLADKIRVRHPDLLFGMIYRKNTKLNGEFACMLARSLWQQKRKDRYFSHWVFLLISSGKLNISIYARLLENCSIPKNQEVALRLFEMMTEPKMILKGTRPFNKHNNHEATIHNDILNLKTGFDLRCYSDANEIGDTWGKVLLPNLKFIYNPLLRICEEQIHTSYSILAIIQKRKKAFDILNFDRSSIAEHRQDRNPSYPYFSILVNILREIIEFLMNQDNPKIATLRESWWHSPYLIFKRLVIYSYTVDRKVTPDEAIQWLITKKLIFKKGFKKEVFDCLTQYYSGSSSIVKKRLLRTIEGGNKGSEAKKLTQNMLDYQKYRVLKWLFRDEKKCNFLNDALKQIEIENPDFKEEKHPEFDFYFETIKGKNPIENFNDEETLDKPSQDFAKTLIQFRMKSPYDFWSYSEVISTLFVKNRDWTYQMIQFLGSANELDQDDWIAIFCRLREASQSNDAWQYLLQLVEELPQKSEVYGGITNLLYDSIWKNNSLITSNEIERAALLIQKAWHLCKHDNVSQQLHRNWLETALCHVGGWIGQFWVHYCSYLYEKDKKNWTGIPQFMRKILEEVVNGETQTQIHARIAITPWLAFFYEWDPEFSKTVFLPMFEWNKDSKKAQQTWSVLLNYQRGRSSALEKILIPYYKELAVNIKSILEETTENMNKFDERALNHFGFNVAAISIHEEANPLKSDLINHFLPRMQIPSRIGFSQYIKLFLKESTDQHKEMIWKSWLKEYIDLRIDGIPTPLIAEEGNEMIEWCLYLEIVFSEAVDLLIKVRCDKILTHKMISVLKSSNLIETEPLHSCKLLLFSLEHQSFFIPKEPILELYNKWKGILNRGKDKTFRKFEDLLIRRGILN
ncbi:MAG: DUF4020 domain-containing protein [Flavobacteriaceae bacterium]|nr:DUF4020 domain-containing protein [Flavobacteriaceae bacterium]